MKNKLTTAIILSLLAGGGAGYAIGNQTDGGKTVASVNGSKISETDLFNMMKKQVGTQAVDNLITNKLIEQETSKANISATDAEIVKELDSIIAQYGTETQFKEAMEASGTSTADVKKDLALTVKLKKLLQKDIKLTEKEKKDYFEQNKATYSQPEQVKASHILVYDKKTADELLGKVKKGDDFAELAKKNSKDTGSAENGGDLGFFGKGQMEPEFEAAAFATKPGSISDIISYQAMNPETGKEETRYHIIKVVEKKEAKDAVYVDHAKAVEEALMNQKMQEAYTTWLEKAKSMSKIENKLAPKQ